jgi:RNA polymerase sigma factor (sigma-70 family)
MVLAAGHKSSPGADAALASLCETYWFPLYAYARRRGFQASEAQDLTQDFFTKLLEKEYVAVADPNRGRFRAFLLTSFKHFISKQRDKDCAQKRGGGQTLLSLDMEEGESRYAAGPIDRLTPEQIYDRQWTVALLERVMQQLEEEMRQAGKAAWFDELKAVLIGSSEGSTYAVVAEKLRSTEAAVKMAAHRLRKRYRELLRLEIAETVEHVADVDDEIRRLFATFSN